LDALATQRRIPVRFGRRGRGLRRTPHHLRPAAGPPGHHRPEVARASRIRIAYYVFDLLHLDGKSTVDLPLIWRKRLLRSTN